MFNKIKNNRKNFLIFSVTILAILGVVLYFKMNISSKNINNIIAQSEIEEDDIEVTEYKYEGTKNDLDEPNNKELEKLINISDCTEEFMEKYYEDVKELQDIGNKENIVIVISEKDIENTYGATKIVKAPNNQYLLQYKNEKAKEKAIESLKNDENIISAEENHAYKALEDDNKNIKTLMQTEEKNNNYNSWGIHKTGLDEAKEKINTEGTQNNITVAIIDSGCDVNLVNSNYNGKIEKSYDVITNSELLSDMTDNGSHGTHIAGTIAEGTPDNVKILPVKAESADEIFYDSDVILAINYIVQDKKADVINMSFGGYYKEKNQAIEQAIMAANNENIICVAAAGNDNRSSDKHYPSAYGGTIAISSFNQKMNKSDFSNYGSTITFSAPGSDILSINGTKSGTSMATPHAVCAIAILKSYNKNYDMNEVVEILKHYAIDLGNEGWDQYYGYGAINVEMNYCNCGCDNCKNIYCEECECSNCKFNEKNVIGNAEIINTIDYGSLSDVDINNLKLIEKYTNGTKKCLNVKDIQDNFEITEYNQNGLNTNGKFKYNNIVYTYNIELPYISNTWEYEQLQNNTVKLTQFKQSNVNTLYIPATIDGYVVTEIGNDLFRYKNNVNGKLVYNNAVKGIKKYSLPDCVVYIGSNAFLYSFIEELEANNISIGNSAFESCSNLTNVNCNKILNIEKFAFNNCDSLQEINIPEGLESIGIRAFSECENLKKVVLPRSLNQINGDEGGQYASQDAFNNSPNVILYLYKDTYAHNYAKNTSNRFKLLDGHSFVKVNLNRTEYVAFEKVSVNNMEVADSEDDYNNGIKETINSTYIVAYQTGENSLRCGDEYCTVTTSKGELLEGKAYVTVNKAQYNIVGTVAERLGKTGQKLEDISLPPGFEWMDKDIVLVEVGNMIYKARYIPADTNNYEIVENVDINVKVELGKTILKPSIVINDKTYDGADTISNNDIVITGLESLDYDILSAKTVNSNIGNTVAKIKVKITDEEFINYAFDNGKQEKEFEVDVNVLPLELIKPTLVEKEYVYNGNEQTIELNNFVADKMNISGNKRTNAGEQSTTISLKNNNYIWNDGTRNNIEFTFKINKADSNIKYSASNMIYKYDEQFYGIELNLESPSNAIIKYANENDEYILDEMPQYNEIGTYTIKYRIYINDNYTDIFGENTLAIVENYVIGDINGDGKVNIKDWNILYNHINETEQLTGYQLLCADINGDGKVNIKDWNRMYDHITEVNPLW